MTIEQEQELVASQINQIYVEYRSKKKKKKTGHRVSTLKKKIEAL